MIRFKDFIIDNFEMRVKWFVFILLSFIAFAAFSQMQIRLLPPLGFTEDSMDVEISAIFIDSTKQITKDKISVTNARLSIMISNEACTKGMPLQYVVTTKHKNYSGQLMGSCDSLVLDLNTQTISYDVDHSFYRLYLWNNQSRVDTTLLDSIDAEIIRLRKKGYYSNFLDFIIYQATLNNYYRYSDLSKELGVDTMSSYWIRGLRYKLNINQDVLAKTHGKIDSLINSNEIIMLKFWGRWCQPCLRDNKIIEEKTISAQAMPYILGIQNDKTVDHSTRYPNILDSEGMIAKAFNLNAYPLYILMSEEGELIRTNSLTEIFNSSLWQR